MPIPVSDSCRSVWIQLSNEISIWFIGTVTLRARAQRAGLTMKNLPLAKVYQVLEPGPVVLLTTACKGCANVMTMSWHMMVEFEPPLVACVVSNADYSFVAMRATRQCVIAIPAAPPCTNSRGRWKLLRPRRCEVRKVRPDAAEGQARGRATDRRVFRQFRVQSGR